MAKLAGRGNGGHFSEKEENKMNAKWLTGGITGTFSYSQGGF